jgi:hypothetical protein
MSKVDSPSIQIHDRLDWNNVLKEQVENILESIGDNDQDIEDVTQGILTLEHLIPSIWKDTDQQWGEDYKASQVVEYIDVRVRDCGVPLSMQWHIDNGLEIKQEQVSQNYFALLQACVDLLYRRGLIQRVRLIERASGKEAKKEETKRIVVTPYFDNPETIQSFAEKLPDNFIDSFKHRYRKTWNLNQTVTDRFEETLEPDEVDEMVNIETEESEELEDEIDSEELEDET